MAISTPVKRSVAASIIGLVSLSTLVSAKPSRAAILNGGFETGDFTGWSTIGDSSVETLDYGSGPTEGTYDTLLKTADVYEGELGSVSNSEIESFLSLAPSSLDTLISSNTNDGSAIKQTFTAKAGDSLSFKWNFLTTEATPEQNGFNDFAFVSISGRPSKLADTFSSFFSSSSTDFDSETGFETFSYTVPTDGTYTLGLGVLNTKDAGMSSGLLVDDVRLDKSVPEPDSVLYFLTFGALCAVSTLKRKKRSLPRF